MSKYVLRTETSGLDEVQSVQHMKETIFQENMAGIIFFCSNKYDLKKLENELNNNFDCPVVGCTTAGEIGSHYQEDSIVAASFSAEKFLFHIKTLSDLEDFNNERAKKLIEEMKSELSFNEGLNPEQLFAFLLIDGLSLMEEYVTANLYSALEGVQLFGGSAGDDLDYSQTFVFSDGKFQVGTAALCLIETTLPFKVFKAQHYTPSDKDLVITVAEPKKRVVYEINGSPAATEYAQIMEIPKEKLKMEVSSVHPLMLQIGDDWYIRSVLDFNEDDSISFACAIESGLALTIGNGGDLSDSLSAQLEQLKNKFHNVEITIGCDCIHRRLEILQTGQKDSVENLLRPVNFIGFSTYGEQFNPVHVNQTLTGVMIGEA